MLTLGGGVVLAIAVFLPFYAVTFTASGVAAAQQNLNSVAQQFGNSAFQSTANSVGSQFGSLVGKQLGTVSSHQVMKYISVVLLVLAGIDILVTIVRLTGTTTQSAPRGNPRADRIRGGAVHRVPDARAPVCGRGLCDHAQLGRLAGAGQFDRDHHRRPVYRSCDSGLSAGQPGTSV